MNYKSSFVSQNSRKGNLDLHNHLAILQLRKLRRHANISPKSVDGLSSEHSPLSVFQFRHNISSVLIMNMQLNEFLYKELHHELSDEGTGHVSAQVSHVHPPRHQPNYSDLYHNEFVLHVLEL